MPYYGLLNLSFWGCALVTLILTQITLTGVTIYLHRCQSHRALDLHPIIAHFFRFWLWMTTGMVTKAWVAIHRKHHAHCETQEDPHSPQILGLKKVLWEGAELYRKEAVNQATLERYGLGTPNDWLERHVYSRHNVLGVSFMLIVDVLLFGLPGISIWGVQMLWIPFFAAGIINGIGHYWGYRNFECPNAARNIIPWGIFVCGEELHNNHHTFIPSAKLSVKWWEIDLGWYYIRLLELLGLAKVKRSIPKLYVQPTKLYLDTDTLKALLNNRFRFMDDYWREVVKPVFKAEKRKAGKRGRYLFRRARRLLIREQTLISAKAKCRLEKLLSSQKTLQTVYEFRVRLQEIWKRAAVSQKERIIALQEWCKQAEASGIDALREFAGRLKTYSLQPA